VTDWYGVRALVFCQLVSGETFMLFLWECCTLVALESTYIQFRRCDYIWLFVGWWWSD